MPGLLLPSAIANNESSNKKGGNSITTTGSGNGGGGRGGPGGESIVREFEIMAKRAGQVQLEVLRDILAQNRHTLYLARFLLDSGSSVDSLVHSFRQCVPLVTHSDLLPYIRRIVDDGDTSPLLTAAPIHTVSLSSGTTNGSQKYIPWYEEMVAATVYVAKLTAAFRSRVYPVARNGRMLEFIFCGEVYTTRGGVKAGTATTHIFQSEVLKQKHKGMRVRTCSPPEVLYQKKEAASSLAHNVLYCHLLCGLLHTQEVELVSSTFAYTLVEAFRTLEQTWPQLCQDIRAGSLSDAITDPAVRKAIGDLLAGPNPALADVIAAKMELLSSCADPYAGLIPCMWPRCKYILSIMTGTMEPYLGRLRHYAGSVPLVSADYGATEGWVAVNRNPEAAPADVSFTVVPSLAYFEFIPLHRRNNCLHTSNGASPPAGSAAYEEAHPVTLTEVKVGQEYEVVMTTYGGLYRYRLGDIVRVTGFYYESPQFMYVCRKDVVLSLNIDKVTEKDLLTLVNHVAMRARKEGGCAVDLVDFTSYADLSTTPGHYVIFWEVRGSNAHVDTPETNKDGDGDGDGDGDENENEKENEKEKGNEKEKEKEEEEEEEEEEDLLMQSCVNMMEKGLLVEPGYKCSRSAGTIGPLELCIVKRGTFNLLLQFYLSSTKAAITQYKTPRCINSTHHLRLLQNYTLKSFFSSSP